MIAIAVCGAGSWGKSLVRAFASEPGARLAYICDRQPEVRSRMSRLYPDVPVVDRLATALADPAVQGVVIAAEATAHHALARAAIDAGKHVFVEKPLVLSSHDAQDLVEAAAKRGVKLMVGHLLEYHPAVNYLKQMIDIGEVDPLYACFTRVNLGTVRQAENAWWSLAPHDISIACYLFGASPVAVSATGQSYLQPDIEDVVFASLRFADRRLAHIHVSWLDPHKIRKVTLVGQRKMVVFDDMEAAEKIRIYDKGADIKNAVDSYAEAISLRSGDILIPRIDSSEPLSLECRHFMDCIRDGTNPRSDGHDGARVVRVLEAGQISLRRGGAPVSVESLQPTLTHD